jgi:hypothetical protein
MISHTPESSFSHIRVHRLCRCSDIHGECGIPKEKITEGEEDIVSSVRNLVVTHVIGASEAQTPRKPSVHVDAPVDFIGGNQVDRPAYEDAGRDPESEYEV